MRDTRVGEIFTESGPRDAIHIAIVPVLAGEDLETGTRIRVVGGKAYKADSEAIGIVDPYLDESYVPEDMWVNMFLLPNTISDLTHRWSLQKYDDNEELKPLPRLNAESVEWLEEFAHMHSTSYDALIVRCQEALSFGRTYDGSDGKQYSWVTFYGRDIHTVPKGFWKHFKRATGWRISKEKIDRVIFTCTC